MRVRYSFGSRHTGNIANIRKQREKFPKVLLDVVRTSDIILQVLDARFIEETRNKKVEEMISKMDKKLIFVLNKADLVDFKISREAVRDLRTFVQVSCKTGRGAKDLRDKIKIEVKRFKRYKEETEDNRERIHIGIVGYPNTGKSSLINLITRRGAASTANQAGHTKGMQKIRFLKDVIILDSPGVIPEEEYTMDKHEKFLKHVKVGARTFNNVKNPEEVIYHIFEDYSEQLKSFYNIHTDNVDDFIEEVGRTKGFLVSGGKVDIDRTTRLILRDWQDGNIKLK